MMLEVSDVSVSYGTTHAVRGITFTVEDNEAVALLGANGAGKTSTLDAISGMVVAGGQIRFDGQDIAGLRPERLARLGLVHVPEGRHVFPTLTVEENLDIGKVAAGARRGFTGDEIFDLFPALVKLRHKWGYTLSGGEQQMLAIGRGLLAAPKLLMLDEPSLGLAPIVAKSVFRALKEIRGRTSLLVVEQNTALALQSCDRAYVIAEGRVVVSGTAADLADRGVLVASVLGQKNVGLGL